MNKPERNLTGEPVDSGHLRAFIERVERLEAFLGWETRNRYAVHVPSGVGEAYEAVPAPSEWPVTTRW